LCFTRWQRFFREDPLGFNGGDANLYSYVGNSPINFVDPLGLEWQATLGANVFIGGSPFLFPAVFGGGGANVGITSSGQIIVQVQAKAAAGIGLYAGAGAQWGIGHSDCETRNGVNTQISVQFDGNAGWGASSGVSYQYSGLGNFGGSRGFGGRWGAGYGIQASAVVTTTTTIAIPIPLVYSALHGNGASTPSCGCK
jgi:hypothetical protein